MPRETLQEAWAKLVTQFQEIFEPPLTRFVEWLNRRLS